MQDCTPHFSAAFWAAFFGIKPEQLGWISAVPGLHSAFLGRKMRPKMRLKNAECSPATVLLLPMLKFANSGPKILLYPHWNPRFLILDHSIVYQPLILQLHCPSLFYFIHTSQSQNSQKVAGACTSLQPVRNCYFRTLVPPMLYSTYY